MANFNTHISVAFLASSFAGVVAYKAGMLTAPEFLLCGVVGTVGGLLPDIDLDHSVPAQVGFNVASLLMAFALVIYWSAQASIVGLVLVGVVSYAVMRWGVFRVFSKITVHRGIVHSVPYMAMLALIVVDTSFYAMKNTAVLSWFLGLFLFFGTMVHLLLDEMYSVNVFGLKVKKSFGTAFKFFDKSQLIWYTGLYALLAVMLTFAPPWHLFWQNLTDPVTWALLKKSLLPASLSPTKLF